MFKTANGRPCDVEPASPVVSRRGCVNNYLKHSVLQTLAIPTAMTCLNTGRARIAVS